VTIQQVLREWRDHLPRPRRVRGRLAVMLAWAAYTMVYAIALLVVIGVPLAVLFIVARLALD
jgi:hypothetical protein